MSKREPEFYYKLHCPVRYVQEIVKKQQFSEMFSNKAFCHKTPNTVLILEKTLTELIRGKGHQLL